MEIYAKLVRAEPDAVQRFTAPELLGEGRAFVRWVRFAADQTDRTVGIDLANAADSGVGSHATADDEIGVVVMNRRTPPQLSGRRFARLSRRPDAAMDCSVTDSVDQPSY